MDDLRRRFASLDRLPAPDLWDTIELRAAAHDPVARVTAVVTPVPMRSRRSTRRSLVLLAATVALLVALVAGALAIGSRRPPLPAIVHGPVGLGVDPVALGDARGVAITVVIGIDRDDPMDHRARADGRPLGDVRIPVVADRRRRLDGSRLLVRSGPCRGSVRRPGEGHVSRRHERHAEGGAAGRSDRAGAGAGRSALDPGRDHAGRCAPTGAHLRPGPPPFTDQHVGLARPGRVTASGGQVRVAFVDPPVLGHYLGVDVHCLPASDPRVGAERQRRGPVPGRRATSGQ